MKSPITGKEMVMKQEIIETEFRKEKFEVIYHYYLCEDSGEKFEDERLAQLNLNQVYNQHRKRFNLPFPEEITKLRELYGLKASKMSEILGFGINVYRNYENGEIPNSSNARLIQLAQDPKEFKKLVDLSVVLTTKEKEKVLSKVNELILKDEFINFDLQNYLMGNLAPDEDTGYRVPNLEKFSEMVIFFTELLQPYKTRLNKLLFYADFCHFKLYGVSISGCRYRAIDKGPVPFNYRSLFDFLANNNYVDIYQTEFPDGKTWEQFKIHNDRRCNSEIFSESEMEVLKMVAKKFEKTYSEDIVKQSHEEEAWKKNYDNGKKIVSYIDGFRLLNI
ncbi:MAG TPA: type II toxin-antitoxin system antitoxin SocA domain-containing protein [Cyclobacteriaceae bacterium]|nr:type II toxin-antitoxin system antitoxin SocA domain-containing protein [Cyclobacteriaceae bacterium]